MQRADPRTVRALRAVRLGAPSAQSRRCPAPTDPPSPGNYDEVQCYDDLTLGRCDRREQAFSGAGEVCRLRTRRIASCLV